MRIRTKNIVILSLLLILVSGFATGIYLYNKGHVNIRNSPALPVNATTLYSDFITDSVNAGRQYGSKVVLVTGEINSISVNAQQQKIMLLSTNTQGAYINCTFEEPLAELTPGQQVRVKGICSGIGQGDADLGIPGDVYLTRCILEQKN